MPLVPSWNPFLQVAFSFIISANEWIARLKRHVVLQRFQFNWFGKLATCVLLYVFEVILEILMVGHVYSK
jgi:hypothetical protein